MLTFSKQLYLVLGSFLGLTIANSTIVAQENSRLTLPPKHVLESDTLAVLRVDLQAIKAQELLNLFLGEKITPEGNAISMTVNASLNTLRDAGVTEIYASLNAGVLPNGGICLVIPCQDTETVATFAGGFATMISEPFVYSIIQQPDQVIICPKQFENRLKQDNSELPKQRQDLIQGLQSVDAFPHQFVVSLPEDLRETLTRMLPNMLPAEASIELSPKDWAQQVRTIALGWDLPPNLDFQLTTVSPGDEGARWATQEIKRLANLVPGFGASLQAGIEGNRATFSVDNEQLARLTKNLVQSYGQAVGQSQVSNNLKQLAMAMHHYVDTYKQIVPAAITDESGKPLLSWRVTLLPYLGEAELFAQFKLDEPWDSEHNRALIAKMPASYADPTSDIAAGMTRVRLPVFDGSVGAADKPLRLRDITDGTSNTIWLMQAPASAAVEWTKPDRWEMDANNLKQSLFGDSASTYAAFLDGSVRSIDAAKSLEWLMYSLQYADGNIHPSE